MLLLIDGYNLLKNILKTSFVEPKKIEIFIGWLMDYAKIKHHEILIFFDGGPYDRPTYEKKDSRVSIQYTGYRKSADDAIKDYLRNTNLNNVLVVTSDRDINLFAQSLGVNSIDSEAFNILLKESKIKSKFILGKSQAEIIKLNKNKVDDELDKLMQEGSKYLLYKDIDNDEDTGFSKEKTLSRHEKKMLKISKKL